MTQGKYIVPTETGLSLFDILKQADPALVDPGVTAQLERLDDVVLLGRHVMALAVARISPALAMTTPVAGIIRVPNVMEVHPSVPAKTIPQFIAYAMANPDKLNMGSGGNFGPYGGRAIQKMMTGVKMFHVPYRGSPYPDLLAGQVQVMFDTTAGAIEVFGP